jgi:N-methylhydantoinase A
LMAFGGGGPMHAVALAEELRVRHIIVPVHSAVFSALGMLLTELRRDYVRTRLLPLVDASADSVVRQFREMETEAAVNFTREGIPVSLEDLDCQYLVDMRYVGQEHTVKVPFPIVDGVADAAVAKELFHAAHEKRYTYRLPNAVQIVSFHLVARLPVAKPELPKRTTTGRMLADVIVGRRRVDFDAHGIHEAPIYDGEKMEPGMELVGPAIVQEPVVTLVVPPGCRVAMDEFGSYHVYLPESQETVP